MQAALHSSPALAPASAPSQPLPCRTRRPAGRGDQPRAVRRGRRARAARAPASRGLMPTTFVATRCVVCAAYQVQQAKARPAFRCAACGEAQALQRKYGSSTKAKDVRLLVQALNAGRDAEEEEADAGRRAAAADTAAARARAPGGGPSRWDEFAPSPPPPEAVTPPEADPRFVTLAPARGGGRGRWPDAAGAPRCRAPPPPPPGPPPRASPAKRPRWGAPEAGPPLRRVQPRVGGRAPADARPPPLRAAAAAQPSRWDFADDGGSDSDGPAAAPAAPPAAVARWGGDAAATPHAAVATGADDVWAHAGGE